MPRPLRLAVLACVLTFCHVPPAYADQLCLEVSMIVPVAVGPFGTCPPAPIEMRCDFYDIGKPEVDVVLRVLVCVPI